LFLVFGSPALSKRKESKMKRKLAFLALLAYAMICVVFFVFVAEKHGFIAGSCTLCGLALLGVFVCVILENLFL
jgi:hypothetical protein